MELATAIWTRSRVRPFNAASLILALSVSVWAQQAPSTSQKHQAARRQTGTIEYRNTENMASALLCLNRGKATGSSGQSGKAVFSGTNGSVARRLARAEAANQAPKMDARKSPRRYAHHDLHNRPVERKSYRECCSIRSGGTGAQSQVRVCSPTSLGLRLFRRIRGSGKNSNSCLPSHICTKKVT